MDTEVFLNVMLGKLGFKFRLDSQLKSIIN